MTTFLMNGRLSRTAPVGLLAAALVAACGDDKAGTNPGTDAGTSPGDGGTAFPAAVADQVIATYKMLVHRSYQLSVDEGKKLQAAIAAFVAMPDAAKLTAARNAWLASRLPYNQTDAYRFYEGPIDNEEDGPEGAINGWPLDENFVDYTRDTATAGIINNPGMYPDLTADALEELNEMGGEKNLATGYHAIEFLLWGQDDVSAGMGAGKRPHTDFVTGAGHRHEPGPPPHLPHHGDRSADHPPRAGARRLGPGNAMNYAAGSASSRTPRASTRTPGRTPSPRSSTDSARWPAASCRASA